ncbi:APC family permease [Curtobacterium sp. S6]|uniref:APC family permease n=1 Tax=Curtobacterium sp. S6 TaxID=1479623 RepID=UPI00068F862C|nr:APC family permease [Curtobacterium sp. S6]
MSAEAESVTYATDIQFQRKMTLQSAMFIGIGGQIGSGWLFAVLSAAGVAGPAATMSWIIGGFLVLLIALSWMEVGSALPFSGAIVRYPYLSHGGMTGWLMGLSYWLANIALPPIEAIAAITYVGGVFPQLNLLETKQGVSMLSWPNGILLGIALMVFFLAVNIFGVKFLSEANRWITWWKIIVPAATFLLLFIVFKASNFTDHGFFGNGNGGHHGSGSMLQAVAVSGIAFALMGFRGVIDFAGEVRKPHRNIPLGTLGCIVLPLAIYVGLQIAFIGAIDWADAGVSPGDWSGLMSSSWADGPLGSALHASGIALLGAFVTLLLLGAVISPGAAGYLYLGSGSRVAYGLAVNKFFPQALTHISRYGVPSIAILVNFAIGLLFFLPAPSWYRLVGFISSALVLSTMAAPAALMVMRRTAPNMHRPFRLPAAKIFTPIGFASGSLIVFWCGFVTLANLITILLGAMAVYAVCFSTANGWTRRVPSAILAALFLTAWVVVAARSHFVLAPDGYRVESNGQLVEYLVGSALLCFVFLAVMHLITREEGRPHLRGGHWVVFLLLGELAVSSLSEYGPLPEPILGFPWDSVAALLVGFIAYFWSLVTGFAVPEMRDLEEDTITGAIVLNDTEDNSPTTVIESPVTAEKEHQS